VTRGTFESEFRGAPRHLVAIRGDGHHQHALRAPQTVRKPKEMRAVINDQAAQLHGFRMANSRRWTFGGLHGYFGVTKAGIRALRAVERGGGWWGLTLAGTANGLTRDEKRPVPSNLGRKSGRNVHRQGRKGTDRGNHTEGRGR